MFYVKFVEGIKQPRILGGYSTLDKAQERVVDHRTDRGQARMPTFTQEDNQWRVGGPDETYTIWESQ